MHGGIIRSTYLWKQVHQVTQVHLVIRQVNVSQIYITHRYLEVHVHYITVIINVR